MRFNENNHIVYVLNIFYYLLWRIGIIHGGYFRRIIYFINNLFSGAFLHSDRLERIRETQKEEISRYLNDPHNKTGGDGVIFAGRFYFFFYGLLISILPVCAMSFIIYCFNSIWLGSIVALLLGGGCLAYASIAIYHSQRYLRYFKKFEKKDRGWHKFWNAILLAYALISILSFIAGMRIMAEFMFPKLMDIQA